MHAMLLQARLDYMLASGKANMRGIIEVTETLIRAAYVQSEYPI